MANPTLGTATLRTRLDASGLRTGLAGAKRDTQKFSADASTAIRGIGTAFGTVVASQGVRSYLSFMRDSATLAHQATTATALYEKALRRNNESLDEGRRLVQRLADQFGLTNDVVEESATFLLRQGASLETVERALVTAGASGAAAGFDLATAFNNVSVAVATGNSALLKTSGIVSTLGAAELEYARSVGKTVDQLTQQERIQARVNAIYEETKSEIEDVDILLKGLPKSQAEVTKEVTRFRQTAGDVALKVIVPLNQAVSGTLRLVNDLPEPVKNAGIAMAGAATGATALATGIIAIRGALRGLSGLGLLSFGPAGWVALGVTAVAGLAAALAGRDTSLEGAVGKAQKALSGGDAKSLTGALQTVSDRLAPSDPLRARLSELREELARTGEVGAEMAQTIADALNQAMIAPLKAELAALQAQVTTSERLLEGERDAAARNARIEELEREGNRILDEGGVVPLELTRELTQLRYAAEGLGMSSAEIARQEARIAADRVRIAELEKQIAALTSPSAPTPTPTPTPEPDPGPAGTPTDPITVEVAERSGRPIAPSTRRAMDRAEAGGPGAGMSTGMTPAELQAVLAARREHNDAVARLEREAEVMLELRLRGQRREMETIAGVNAAREQARETLANLGAGVQAFAGNVRAARDAVVDARWGDTNAELERFQRNAASLTATLKAAADQEAFAAGLQVFSDRQRGVFGRGTPHAVRPPQADAEAAAARQGVRDAVADFQAGRITIEQLEDAISDITSVTPMTVRELNELGASIARLKEAARAQDFEENPGLYGLPRPVDLAITPTANITGGAVDLTGFQPTVLIDGLEPEEWAARQKRAADSFADTVVSAGFSFGNAAIKAFQDGDVVGVIRAGLSGAGSILGGANLGSLSFLGGSIGIGSLLAGGLGLLGTLLGGLFGGDRNRELEQRRQAEASRARSVPAINIQFHVTQHNQYNGAPSDPQNEQAFARQADALFESIYRRHLGPRLDRIENRLGIAGA